MIDAKLLLDTNIVIDFLSHREPYCDDARPIFVAGKVGVVGLWLTTSQMTDIVYILSNGGRAEEIEGALSRLRALRTFVHLCANMPDDTDAMLESNWKDPEDALLMRIAKRLEADAILSRDTEFATMHDVPVMTCVEFLEWLNSQKGIQYQAFTF